MIESTDETLKNRSKCLMYVFILAFQNMNSKRKAETWKKNRRQLVRMSVSVCVCV